MRLDSKAISTPGILVGVVGTVALIGGALVLISLSSPKSSTSTSAREVTTETSQTSTSAVHTLNVNIMLHPGAPYVASDVQGNFTLVILPLGNLPPTLLLNVSSSTGLNVRLKPSQFATNGGEIIAQVFITVSGSLKPGEYSFAVTAGGGGQTSEKTFNVQVLPFVVYTVGNAFFPANLTVPVGSTVTWMRLNGAIDQYDPGEHDVDFTRGLAHSPTLNQYDSWSYTFSQPGVFDYYCTYHPFMKGSITVSG